MVVRILKDYTVEMEREQLNMRVNGVIYQPEKQIITLRERTKEN